MSQSKVPGSIRHEPRHLRDRAPAALAGPTAQPWHAASVPSLEGLEPRVLLSGGDLDLTFGDGGLVTSFFRTVPLQDSLEAAAVGDDGKIVAVGSTTNGYGRYYPDFAVVRYKPDGALDAGFGGIGYVQTDFGGDSCSHESAFAVALQPDGKIVVAGRADTGWGYDFAMARYQSNGRLDTSFGTGGLVTTDFGTNWDEAYAVALDAGGKIVVAGRSGGDAALARYDSTGSLDTTFDGDGKVVTDLGGADDAQGLVLQPDGKIVIAGTNGSDFALARYNADGSLDTGFGVGGIVICDMGGASDKAMDMARQADGKLIAVGSTRAELSAGYDNFTVARFTVAGLLDTTFDGNGKVMTNLGADYGEGATAVAVQSNGKIVVAGVTVTSLAGDFAVVRYNVDGSLDSAFGGSGKVTTDLANSGDLANDVVLRPDGSIIVVGGLNTGSKRDAAVVRYTGSGALDVTFDSDGKVRTDFMESEGAASSYLDGPGAGAVVQPDGKVVVIGSSSMGMKGSSIVLARFNTDGSPDSSFGTGGQVITKIGDGCWAKTFLLAPDGRILVGGTARFNALDAWDSFNIVMLLLRYTPSGQLDTSFDGDGIVTYQAGASVGLAAMTLQADGSIVGVGSWTTIEYVDSGEQAASNPLTSDAEEKLAGFLGLAGSQGPAETVTKSAMVLMRFTPSGALDSSFGTDGLVEVKEGPGPVDVEVQSDGKIVVLGNPSDANFCLMRFNSDGSPDAAFGFSGVQTVLAAIGAARGSDLVILPGGKLLVLSTEFDFLQFDADGSFDTTFAHFGVAANDLPGGSADLIVQSDGKLLALASGDDFGVARFNADGMPDMRFGSGGLAQADFYGGEDKAYGMALMGDGKIVLAGMIQKGEHQMMGMARFLAAPESSPNGVLSFSTNQQSVDETVGTVTVTVTRTDGTAGTVQVNYATSDGTATAGADYTAASGTLAFAPGVTTQTFDVTILTDLFGEYAETINLTLSAPTGGAVLDNPKKAVITIQRHEGPSGRLDKSFSDDGLATVDFGIDDDQYVHALALQEDGKIIAAGGAMGASGDFLLARFNADGSLDTSFGVDGTVQTDFMGGWGWDEVGGVAVLPDGKILAAGMAKCETTGYCFAAARYNADGSLDRSFGTEGRAISSFSGFGCGLAVLSDGKFLISGDPSGEGVGVARFNADGSLDETFGVDGLAQVVMEPCSAPWGALYRVPMAVQADGKILLAGQTGQQNNEQFAIARFNANGTLDTTWGTGGLVATPEFETSYQTSDVPMVIRVAGDGKILVGGYATVLVSGTVTHRFAVVRYNPEGSLDTSFDGDGQLTVAFSSHWWDMEEAFGLGILENGKIVLSGAADQSQNAGLALAQLNPDGSLDLTFGIGGLATIDTGYRSAGGGDLVVQSNNSVVIANNILLSNAASNSQFVLARVNTEAGPGRLQFVGPTFDVDENDGFAVITVSRGNGNLGAVSVNYATSDGTAVAGQDYTAVSGTLNFADGEFNQTLLVPILDDATAEGIETINLMLSSPGGGATLGSPSTATLSIHDAPGRLQFSSPVFNTSEDRLYGYVTILREGGSSGEVSVTITSSDGTALAGSDFVGVNQTVTFADRQKMMTYNIKLVDDTLVEGKDTLSLTLSNPAGGATLGTRTTTVLNIFDAEPLPAANAGAPDADFGMNGAVRQDFGLETVSGFDMKQQADGKFVVVRDGVDADGNHDFQIARFNIDGSPDSGFGSGGLVTTDFGGEDSAQRLVIQPDGRIVVAGFTVRNGLADFAVARYNADGSLDTSFSGDGMVTTDFGSTDDRAFGVTLQSNGKLIVVGSTGNLFKRDFGIVRYNANGSLDTTFDGDGRVTTDFDGFFDVAADVIVQPDGKIVVGGTAMSHYLDYSHWHFNMPVWAIARYNSNGSLDLTFSGDGKITYENQNINADDENERVRRLLLQPDGKIIVVGSTGSDYLIGRFDPDGSFDNSFGYQGHAMVIFHTGSSSSDDEAWDAVLQADGNILVVGRSGWRLSMARLDTRGREDVSFGVDGKVIDENFGPARAVVLTSEGRIVTADIPSSGGADFELGRFLGTTASPDAGIFQFSDLGYSVQESDGSATVTVTRPKDASFGVVTVDYLTLDGTAQAGLDYTPTSGTLTFGETECTKTFKVPIINDTRYERNETLLLLLSNPTNGAILNSQPSALLTIEANDWAPSYMQSVYVSSTSVQENAGSVNVTVSRSGYTSNTLTVDYATSEGTALAGEDYTEVFGTLVFSAGQTSKTITVPILSDTSIEGSEQFTVLLSNPRGPGIANTNTDEATVTILDVDANICRNAGDLDTTFDSDGKVTTDLGQTSSEWIQAIALQSDGKIVAAGRSGYQGDYALARYNTDGSLDTSFDSDGKVTTNVRPDSDEAFGLKIQADGKILVFGDSTGDGHEQYVLVRYNANGSLDTAFGVGGMMAYPLAYSTDSLPKIAFAPDGKIIVAGSAYNGLDQDMALIRFNADGTLDATFGSGGQVTYDYGFSSENVSAVVVMPDGKIVVVPNSGLKLIRFNADGTLDAGFGSGGVLEPDYTGCFPAWVDRSPSGSFSDLIVQPDGKLIAASTISVFDYQLDPFEIYSLSGPAAVRFNTNFTQDASFGTNGVAIVDLDTWFSINCVALQPNGRIILAGRGSEGFALMRLYSDGVSDIGFGAHGLVITDMSGGGTAYDVLVQPDGKVLAAGGTGSDFVVARYIGGEAHGSFRLDSGAYRIAEDGGSLLVTVTRMCGMDGAVSVHYDTSDGTAHSPADYSATSGTLSWGDREFGPKTFSIPIVNDSIYQGNLTFNIALSNPTGSAFLNTTSSAVVTIVDDESPGQFQFSNITYQAAEDGGSVTISVQRINGKANAVSVNYVVTGGTATAGADFTGATGTLLFADHQTSATFTVTLINDTDVEGIETVLLGLVNPTGGAGLATRSAARLSIIDDDKTPPPQPGQFQFGSVSFRASEDDPAAMITVVRVGGADGEATVDYATSDGTAVSLKDYLGGSGTLLFEDQETSKTFAVPILGDRIVEGAETVNLALSNPSGGATLGPSNHATVTIDDNDAGPVGLTVSDAEVIEGNSGVIVANFTVALSGPAMSAITVDFATADGTATAANGDYVPEAGKLTFNPGEQAKTIQVSVNGDTKNEANESFFVNISGNIEEVWPDDPMGVGTILNDDAVLGVPWLVISSLAQAEGDKGTATMSFDVSLSWASDSTVSVSFATLDGKAAAGSDYVAASGLLTFLPGESLTQTISVQVLGDEDYEADEMFFVDLAGAANAAILIGRGEGTIQNDDIPAVIRTFDGKTKLAFTDATGDPVTVSLKGPGTGEVRLMHDGNCDAAVMVLNGTSAKSALTITTPKATETTVCDIVVHGLLGALTAKTTDLLGDLTVDGPLGKLTLDDVVDHHTISIGASTDSKAAVTIVFDEARGLVIDSDIPVRSLTASRWLDVDGVEDALIAPSVGKLNIKGRKGNPKLNIPALAGDFEASLVLSGAGNPKLTLGQAKIAGGLNVAAWQVTGNIGSIVAAGAGGAEVHATGGAGAVKLGTVKDTALAVGGALRTLQVAEWDGGSIEAGSLGKISATGNRKTSLAGDFRADLVVTGQGAAAGKPVLGSASIAGDLESGSLWQILSGDMGRLTIKGTARGSVIRSAGSMLGITLGASDGSSFLAGIGQDCARHAEQRTGGHDDFVNPSARIKSIAVKGLPTPGGQPPRFLEDTYFSAAFIDSASLLNADFPTCGLFARDCTPALGIKSVTYRDTATGERWSWPAKPGTVFTGPSDFIRIL